MRDHRPNEDELLDRNLRRLAERIGWSEADSPAQLAKWKQPPGPRLAAPPRDHAGPRAPRGGFFMQNRRYFLPAGSAAAAAIILAIVFLTPGTQSVVSARMIMQSLRDSAHQGVRIGLTDIGDEHHRVSGQVAVRFQKPFRLADVINDNADVEPEEVHGSLQITFAESAPEFAGLMLDTSFGLANEDKWVYVRIPDPQPLIDKAPPVAFFARQLQGGLLLDLNSLLAGEDLFGNSSKASAEEMEAVGGRVETHIEQHVEASEAHVREHHEGVHLSLNGEGSDDPELERLVQDLVAGRLTSEDIDLLVTKIEELAGEVTVTQQAPGEYVLTARDLHKAADDAPPEWLNQATLQIGYRSGVGVEWLTVIGLGPWAGSVELTFVDTLDSADRAAREAFASDPATTVVDVGALIKSFEALGQGFEHGFGKEK